MQGIEHSDRPPLYKKIQTSNAPYVYDTWTNEILSVDEAVFSTLPCDDPACDEGAPLCETERERALKEIERAVAQGFFRTDYPRIESFPEDQLDALVDQAQARGTDQLVLNITERCNLRCHYCAYSGAYIHERMHSQRHMTWRTIQAALDWYFGHPNRDEYHVGFYGGEPLLVLDVIQKIVSYARDKVGDLAGFSLTTNGTLLDEDACRFLVDQGFQITVSIDGPAAIHDRYRVKQSGEGSFKDMWKGINRLYRMADPEYFQKHVTFNTVLAPPVYLSAIRAFFNQYPDIFYDGSITMTGISPQPSSLAERLTAQLAPETTPPTLSYTDVYEAFKDSLIHRGKPDRFSGAYLARDYLPVHRRPMTIMSEKTASHGQCIPGTRKCFVDTDGRLYMCERVNPAFAIGHVDTGIEKARVIDFLMAYNRFFSDQCRQCWAVRFCQKCVNSVRRGPEWSEEMGAEFCDSERRNVHRLLTSYCAIREQRDDAFDWTEDIEIS